MNVLRSRRQAAVALLASAVAALPIAGRAADPVEINVILTLTGPATFIGQGARKSLEALEGVVNKTGGINGRPVKFVFQDDQTNPQITLQLANGILGKNASVFLGTNMIAGCRAILPLIKDGPVDYCLTPGLHPDRGSYAFSANVSTNDLAVASMRYFIERGIKRIAIITLNDANGQDADDALAAGLDAFKAQNLIVAHEHFSASDLSVAAQMARIKAADPQMIVAWESGTPLGTVLHAIQDAGLDRLPVLTTNANSNRAEMKQFAQIIPKELYFPDQISDIAPDQIADPVTRRAVQTYITAMAAVGITKTDESYEANWDAASIVIDAFRKLGADASAGAIRDYIGNLKGFTGIKGPYDFRAYPQRGLSQNAVILVRWDPAKDAWIAMSKLGGSPLR
jgi:branched-chain amino acid transport system substrate-binding protein